MSSIKERFFNARSKLLRRQSAASSAASTHSSERAPRTASSLRKSISLSKLPQASVSATDVPSSDDGTGADPRLTRSEHLGRVSDTIPESPEAAEGSSASQDRHSNAATSFDHVHDQPVQVHAACPTLTLEEPTPVRPPVQPPQISSRTTVDTAWVEPSDSENPSELPSRASTQTTAPSLVRRQSLVEPSNTRAIKTLLNPDASVVVATGPPTATDYFGGTAKFNAGMLHRKIWVKRPNASATMVQIREDDLVDDVRDMILKKYGNSLGRSFDSPDITIRILSRESSRDSHQDRTLGPEEEMCRTLDGYYPGGQNVNEALIIEVPKAKTPRPSPRVPLYYAHHDDTQPHQTVQTEYFPPMPPFNPSPAAMSGAPQEARVPLPHAPHSIAVIQTGHLPSLPLPSPGGTRRGHARPKAFRHNTASPTALTSVPPSASSNRPTNRQRQDSSASDTKHSAASANGAIPTPPIPLDPTSRQNSTPPTPRISSPRPDRERKSKKKQRAVEAPGLPAGLLDGSVPPINVLIVEDNIINLRVLGAFMQRLKVRWQRAMNGREAVDKWRTGGFHLVLMDIQLPIMDGLEATREIRRLERVNSIGVFSSGASEAPNTRLGEDGTYGKDVVEGDKLGDKNMFKSPVIIVALTASSLQSDRHEALAAGCNDFLTKVSLAVLPFIITSNAWLARKLCLARAQGQGVGLHASTHRL
jgi:osomolarity two-component system response regulator SSK1